MEATVSDYTRMSMAIWDAISPEMWDNLCRYAERRFRAHGVWDADDLIQELAVEVLQGLAHYDPSRPLQRYLFGMMNNLVRAHLQRAYRERQLFVSFDRVSGGA